MENRHSSALDAAPAHAATAMMQALFGPAGRAEAVTGLAGFQQDAVVRLGRIMDRFGGALLCDSVGLGKTHVAVSVIRSVVAGDGAALVVVPSALRSHWRRHLAGLSRCRLISHASLSRGLIPRSAVSPGIIVVDEAHAFRNPRTQRYRSLALLARDARMLLITATPVNNSLHDILSLIRLFAGDGDFAGTGVPDLQSAVEAAEAGRPRDLQLIVQAVVVRRTRDMAKLWPDGGGNAGNPETAPSLRFPASAPTELVRYDAAVDVDLVVAGIGALRLPAHRVATGDAGSELLRIGLLKRLESSHAAFGASLRRLHILTHAFLSAARSGLLFDVRRDASLVPAVDDAIQLALDPLTLQPWPAATPRADAIRNAVADITVLHRLAVATRTVGHAPATGGREPKLECLHDLLVTELEHARVIVFTEYRDTARAIARRLSHLPGVALIHGGEARLGRMRASRRTIIERFAPHANHVREPPPSQAVRVLVATDVLAEGLNLQDASVVISYDLPWNPVRLAQRAGRIDRLGSPHARIRVLALAPSRGLERLLGLLRRIRRKLRHIRTVGGDGPDLVRRVVAPRTFDAAAHSRERARIAWLTASTRTHAFRSRPRSSGIDIVHWSQPTAATLCCVQYGGEPVLILMRDDDIDEVSSAAAWDALREAFATGSAADASVSDTRGLQRRAARCLARRHDRRSRRSGTAGTAAVLVRRWLSSRPGGPAVRDLIDADAILSMVDGHARAGDAARVQDVIERCDDPEDAIARLVALAHSCPAATSASRPRLRMLAAIRLQPAR
jgi:hypothetical protein